MYLCEDGGPDKTNANAGCDGAEIVLEDDDLMFGGMERVMDPPLNSEEDSDNEIRLSCEKEVELYLKTPGIPLRNVKGEFLDALAWWEAAESAGKFPTLCKLAEFFLQSQPPQLPRKGSGAARPQF